MTYDEAVQLAIDNQHLKESMVDELTVHKVFFSPIDQESVREVVNCLQLGQPWDHVITDLGAEFGVFVLYYDLTPHQEPAFVENIGSVHRKLGL